MNDRQYVEHRVMEALKKTNGNAARARQQIIAWTYEDAKLLHALTKPHLNGIVAYNIDRVISGRAAAAAGDGASDAPKKAANEMKEENFGLELLKAVAGNSGQMFGFEGPGGVSVPRKNQVSKKHMDAIKAMTKGRSFDE